MSAAHGTNAPANHGLTIADFERAVDTARRTGDASENLSIGGLQGQKLREAFVAALKQNYPEAIVDKLVKSSGLLSNDALKLVTVADTLDTLRPLRGEQLSKSAAAEHLAKALVAFADPNAMKKMEGKLDGVVALYDALESARGHIGNGDFHALLTTAASTMSVSERKNIKEFVEYCLSPNVGIPNAMRPTLQALSAALGPAPNQNANANAAAAPPAYGGAAAAAAAAPAHADANAAAAPLTPAEQAEVQLLAQLLYGGDAAFVAPNANPPQVNPNGGRSRSNAL